MIWHKFIIQYRNKISSMISDLDSCAMIEGSKLSEGEREAIRVKLYEVLMYIDGKLDRLRPKN